ncbi:MAG: single-stranded DNA-binding protein [Rikenellaceae bacterium]
MMTTNRISLLGNAVKKATITTFEGGNRVAQLSLATNERGFTAKSGRVVPDRTDFHTLIVKGGLVDVVEKYIDKGSKMAVIGSLRYRDFVNKSGQKCRVAEIHVREIELLGKGAGQQSQAQPHEEGNVAVVEKQVFTATDEDDLPF